MSTKPTTRPTGKPDPMRRRLPARITCATSFEVPDRLLREPGLSPEAKLVGFAICSRARGAMAIAAGNADLLALTGLSLRPLQRALDALEAAGFVHRLYRWDRLGRDNLDLVGYRDPWDATPGPRPRRALVLLWRLPELAPSLFERAASGTSRGAPGDTFTRPRREGGAR